MQIDTTMASQVSNLSKHVVATIFLVLFTLNGAMVVDSERIASLLLACVACPGLSR